MSAAPPRAARDPVEIAVGAAVIAVVVVLLVLALGGRVGSAPGTEFRASFGQIGALGPGSDVRIAGVRVGRVTATAVDPKRFLATVTFRVRPDIALPVDTSATIASEGLLGGEFLSISPGGDRRNLAPGGLITATQGAISLTALLGQFIGSVTGLMDAVKQSNAVPHAPGMATGSGAPAPLGGDLGP